MFNSNEVRTNWRLADLIDKARIELPKHHADRFANMSKTRSTGSVTMG